MPKKYPRLPTALLACGMALSVWPVEDVLAKIKPPVHPPRLAPRIPVIGWSPCTGEVAGLQCSFATVPLDYNNPDGPQISLALARVPARRPDLRIGSLFINPGGPGGSGVDMVRAGFSTQIDTAVLDRFDIVGWDPRGIGQSTPIQCWASDAARQSYFANSPVFPYRSDQEQTFFGLWTNVFNLCANRGQTILWHMSTANVARDLDLLRQAVGDVRLNYLGYSYGSYIGHTYANMFSMNIRAMVIDGVLDPVRYSSGNQLESNKSSFNALQQQFFSQCAAAGAQCALNGNGDPKARFDRVLNALRTNSIAYNDGQGHTTVYTYDTFVEESSNELNTPEDWSAYAARVAAMSNALPPVRGVPKSSSGSLAGGARTRSTSWEIQPGNFTESFLGNHCADIEYPSTLQQYSQRGLDAAASSIQGPQWAWETTGCASWPVSQSRYRGPWTMATSAPVLIVGNYYDGATEYAGAVESSRLLPNSRLLSYAGWGHGTAYTGRSACVSSHVSQYLISGSLPASGTVCPAAQNPFTVTTKHRGKRNPAIEFIGKPMWKRAAFVKTISRPAAGSPPTRRR